MPHGAVSARADQKAHKTHNWSGPGPPAPARARRAARSPVFAGGAGRPATRGDGNPVIEREYGITVYPAREGQDRWRAVWYENGSRRQCEAVSGERLAARLEKVTERLAADAPNMERTGADLIAHYLDPDRLPADRRWSRKHAHTQRRLCERLAVPVIGRVACQDIQTWHMQQVVNAAPTAGEGAREPDPAADAIPAGRPARRAAGTGTPLMALRRSRPRRTRTVKGPEHASITRQQLTHLGSSRTAPTAPLLQPGPA
jgi:hypothetical protein